MLQPDGNILLGGDFTSVNGVMRQHIARLYGDAFPLSLNLEQSSGSVILTWPVSALNFQLQETTNLALPSYRDNEAFSSVVQSR